LARNHTTLIIAHRLSTIVHADQILVMDQGQIVERGSHAELIDKEGTYAQMWNMQKRQDDQVS
jgi:ATP-binding cassette subfamily B protein